MILTTQNCVSLMRLITQMGMRDKIITSIKTMSALENKKNVILNEIKSKAKSDEDEAIKRVLLEDEGLRGRYNAINEEYTGLMFEMIFSIVEGIPRAEETFYKVIAEIKGTDITTEKGVDGGDNALFIKEVISSETFTKFFNIFFK